MGRVSGMVVSLRNSSFLRHNAVFFFGSLAVGILNYAFYPVVARLLSVSDYGEVQALVSLFTQLGVFLTVLSLVVVNIVSNYKDEDQKRRVSLELEKLGLAFSIIVFILGVLFSKELETFFRFGSIWPFIVMLLAFIVTVPLVFRNAFLRGHKKFGQTSIASIISSGSQIFISAALIIAGFGAIGAIGGLVIAQLLAFGYAINRSRKIGFRRPSGARYFDFPEWKTLKPEVRYSLFVLLLSLIITVLSTIDIFVVKHYFSPRVAGLYAGVSIIGRSIYFLTAPIAGVLLPLITTRQSKAENRLLLVKSFGLLGLVGGVALLVFSLFPRTIISVLMGHKFLAYAHLLPSLSLAMFLFSIINLCLVYYIALRVYQVSVIVILGIIITALLMLARHQSVGAVVSNLVYSGILILVLLFVWNLIFSLRTKPVDENT